MNFFMMKHRQCGLSLIELMIAMVLGLLVTLGVVNLFLTTRTVYRQNENLARIQENARFAFEFLGREIREAGGISCGSNLPTANVLNNPETNWWSNWGDGIHGYDDTQDTFPPKRFGSNSLDRVAGTDAFVVMTSTQSDLIIITDHNPNSAQFKVNATAHGLADGDIVMVCDYRQAAIFQITNANSSNVTIVHNTGGSVSPGNCSKGLGVPTVCTTNGTPYTFEKGGFLGRLSASAWYVGHNDRGGTSLYRVRMRNNRGSADTITEEIVEGVTNMQVTYLVRASDGTLANDYVGAAALTPADWPNVVAARVALTFSSLENVGTEQQSLVRSLASVYTLRNRVP